MSKRSLFELQSWLHHSIQSPQTNDLHSLEQRISGGYGVSPQKRLAIYQTGYMLRLLECLRSEYRLLISAFSAEWFDLMAQHYLRKHPPSSTNLNDLSAHFPDFLANDRPDKNHDSKEQAYDFMIALARFERAKLEVGRSKGSEEGCNQDLLVFETHDLDLLNVVLAENLHLLKVPFQLTTYLENESQSAAEPPPNIEQNIIVCRDQYRVVYFQVDSWKYDLIVQLQTHTNLGAGLETVQKQYSKTPVYILAPLFLSYLLSKGGINSVSVG